MRSRILGVLLAVAIATAPVTAGKKRQFYLGKRPPQSVAVTVVPEVVAEQPCPNFIFAAAMETMLRQQGVTTLDQRFWVGKLNGDLTCRPLPGNDLLQKLVEGEYPVEPNRHVRLSVRYTDAFPAVTDNLLVPLSQQRTYLLVWKGGLYLVTGASWQEMYFQTGQKMVEITRLAFVDLTARGADRTQEFTRDKDPASELGGMFEVVAEPVETENWKH